MEETTAKELAHALQNEHDTLVKELKGIATENPHARGDWNALYPKFETEESGSHANLDEEADEVEEYEERLATEKSLESRLLETTKALERVKKGTYGICLKCGKEIPLDRLKANPAAEFDIEHTP